MAIKYSPRCLTCNFIQQEMPKLEDRLNRCAVYVAGGESMLNIYKDLGGVGPGTRRSDRGTLPFSYNQLRSHTARHQAPSKHALASLARARSIRNKANLLRQEEDKAVIRDAKERKITYKGHTTTRPELIQAVLDALAEGGVKLSGTNLVQLLAQEQRADENAKDRSLELMKMVNFFAAGAAPGADKWSKRTFGDDESDGPSDGPIDNPIEGQVL